MRRRSTILLCGASCPCLRRSRSAAPASSGKVRSRRTSGTATFPRTTASWPAASSTPNETVSSRASAGTDPVLEPKVQALARSAAGLASRGPGALRRLPRRQSRPLPSPARPGGVHLPRDHSTIHPRSVHGQRHHRRRLHQLRQAFVGIEQDPVYFDYACERIRKAWAAVNTSANIA